MSKVAIAATGVFARRAFQPVLQGYFFSNDSATITETIVLDDQAIQVLPLEKISSGPGETLGSFAVTSVTGAWRFLGESHRELPDV